MNDTIEKIFTAVTSPSELFGGTCSKKDIIYLSDVEFVEDNNTYYTTSLSLTNLAEGTYYLVFIVNGIESQRSREINIVQIPNTESIFPDNFEIIYTSIMIFIVLISNLVLLNKYFTLISILVVAFEFVVIQQSNKQTTFQISSYFALGMLVFAYILAFPEEQKGRIFASNRIKAYKLYTEIKFFGNKYHPVVRKKKSLGWDTIYSGDPLPKDFNINPPFHKLGWIQRMISLFKSFSIIITNPESSPDCFYFPQRLIATLLLALFIFTIISVNIAIIAFGFIDRYSLFYYIL